MCQFFTCNLYRPSPTPPIQLKRNTGAGQAKSHPNFIGSIFHFCAYRFAACLMKAFQSLIWFNDFFHSISWCVWDVLIKCIFRENANSFPFNIKEIPPSRRATKPNHWFIGYFLRKSNECYVNCFLFRNSMHTVSMVAYMQAHTHTGALNYRFVLINLETLKKSNGSGQVLWPTFHTCTFNVSRDCTFHAFIDHFASVTLNGKCCKSILTSRVSGNALGNPTVALECP